MMATIITGFAAFMLNKAIPAIFHHKVKQAEIRVELAKDLCQNHNDCEAQKALAMKGLKK